MDNENVVEVKSLTIEELDKLLEKYFKTQEQIKIENEELQKEVDNAKEIERQELENKELSTVEFQNQLLTEIKTLQENTSINYHISYVALVLSGLIFCYVLFYKFLKIFI